MAYQPVHQVRDITLQYVAPGGATLEVFFDLPGNVITLWSSYALPATGASDPVRRTIALFKGGVLPDARMYRVRITPPSNNVAKILQGEMSVKRYGVFIDNVSGPWETDVLSIGG